MNNVSHIRTGQYDEKLSARFVNIKENDLQISKYLTSFV